MSSSPMVDRFARWFSQECDAIDRVLSSLETVPPSHRATPEFGRATTLLAHLVVARSIWLSRFDGSMPSPPPLFPPDETVAQVASNWSTTRQAWQTFLATLTDDRLGHEFNYRSSDGGTFHNTIEEVMVHLFAHGAYHRGQIAMLVRAAGGEPATTDYIYWCRHRTT